MHGRWPVSPSWENAQADDQQGPYKDGIARVLSCLAGARLAM